MNFNQNKLPIYGAVLGDILGSSYEFHPSKDYNLKLCNLTDRFTDDTVCTVAVSHALQEHHDFAYILRFWCRRFPRAGYGGNFFKWWQSEDMPAYNSWGNGSAMRVSPVGAYSESLEEALEYAKKQAEVTHNHPEGIKGAQAIAAAIYLAKTGSTKQEIKDYITDTFGYNLDRTVEDMRPGYKFDVSCQGSVPESIICFLESSDYESCVRNAISMGGDADTMACMAGGIAAAFYKEIPDYLMSHLQKKLDPYLYVIL